MAKEKRVKRAKKEESDSESSDNDAIAQEILDIKSDDEEVVEKKADGKTSMNSNYTSVEVDESEEQTKTFKDLGVIDSICETCEELKFTKPTPIQAQSIPYALEGRDIIGLAQTGSGKTAAFAIPVLQSLYENPQPLYCVVLAPTRELAYQISETFEALGSAMGLRTAVVVGGMNMMTQAVALSKKPHVIVATPGRLVDHLENTKGFSLRTLKYLVMDEADRLLDMEFGPSLDKILKVIPRQRNTYLFSATMTSKVEKLQRASLVDPVRVAVSTKYQTADNLLQYMVFCPFKHKDTHLVYLVSENAGNSMIIFARTKSDTQRISLLLRNLGYGAIPLHGDLSQTARLGALNKFKSGSRNILIATDVASRGLDIPAVDLVINYDIPSDSKSYIHRVGRTARAGRAGKSVALVSQYDLELYLRIEAALGKKLDSYPLESEAVMLFSERVAEASRAAIQEMKGEEGTKKRAKFDKKRRRDEMDIGE
ncbi:ATP-dependent rRNA helicase RRP3 [Yarrowia sp. C11]|nr:ATP-dependent rRNA helicase RRP3 [Yarrowia sp. E02]KAG5369728.1 ATP-dependent rRNA helicase RRP3 [Yarrowia sp. C11]